MKKIIVILLIILAAIFCIGAATLAPTVQTTETEEKQDVPYQPSPCVDEDLTIVECKG